MIIQVKICINISINVTNSLNSLEKKQM